MFLMYGAWRGSSAKPTAGYSGLPLIGMYPLTAAVGEEGRTRMARSKIDRGANISEITPPKLGDEIVQHNDVIELNQ